MKNYLVTECPGSGYPINIVNYFKKGVTTSWTHSKPHSKPDSLQYFFEPRIVKLQIKMNRVKINLYIKKKLCVFTF